MLFYDNDCDKYIIYKYLHCLKSRLSLGIFCTKLQQMWTSRERNILFIQVWLKIDLTENYIILFHLTTKW